MWVGLNQLVKVIPVELTKDMTKTHFKKKKNLKLNRFEFDLNLNRF